jgi:hypothetical protein
MAIGVRRREKSARIKNFKEFVEGGVHFLPFFSFYVLIINILQSVPPPKKYLLF